LGLRHFDHDGATVPLGEHPGPGGVHPGGDLPIEGRKQVPVQTERSRHVGVAQPLLDRNRVGALSDRQGTAV
jgi:hypothetical protein